MFRIQIERERLGLTRARLAARADLHPSEYGKFEAGRHKPYPVQVERLAQALGVPAESLFEQVPDSQLPRTK